MFRYGQKSIRRRTPACRLEHDGDTDGEVISPLLKRIFENRRVDHVSKLGYAFSNLHEPDLLKDGEIAACLVGDAIQAGRRVLIIGDYDADGATAAALTLSGLKAMGLGNVDYLVPNRFQHGYGLSPEIAEVALQKSPEVVITVDNGINSVDGVALLKNNAVTVIITDHHLPTGALPAADAILNPNQPGCQFPSKAIAGVGVAFYLLLLLRAKLKSIGWFEKARITPPNLGALVDLVALGTVADMVPLDYNNRILVANGVGRIRNGKCRPGILALLEAGGRKHDDVVAADCGFVIAPRLNAAGRLEDMSAGIECLLAENMTVACEHAQRLNRINQQRKEIQSRMQRQAMEVVEGLMEADNASGEHGKQTPAGFCLHEAGWHQGISGLVAARIREKTDQPAIAFATTESGDLTGSARSVPGLHIKDLLESIATENHGLIEKFGGHAMAAGLTVRASNYDQFRERFHARVTEHYLETGIDNAIDTDGELAAEDITLANAQLIREAAPWGQGFPTPKFDGEFVVLDCRIVGQIHLRMKLESVGQGMHFQGIVFKALERGEELPELDRIHAVYELGINQFMGDRSLQLMIEYFESI